MKFRALLPLIAMPALAVLALPERSLATPSDVPNGDEPPPSSALSTSASSTDQLGVVLVTAQRRAEDLQSVPIDVTSRTATELADEGVTDTAELSLAVPGLSYTMGGNGATPFIRGVGTTINSLGNEASVATYIDGVYISSINAAIFELNNIERVEVLKGPQGTLFGRNASGGVIQILTKDPSSTPTADLRVGYGNYGTSNGSFYGTTGLGPSIAIDLAAYGTNQANGWGVDFATGQPTFTRHDYGGRSKLLWTPDDGTRILFAADYNRTRNEDGLGYHIIPPGVGIDGVTRYNGFYNNFETQNDHSDVSQNGLSLTLGQDIPAAHLENIVSWRNVNGSVHLDQDATPLAVVGVPYWQHDKTVTEELHLLSREGASLPWIVGTYYFDDLSSYQPLGLTGQAAAPLDEVQIWSAQRSHSYAAFGQVTPRIAIDTRLTLGLRYTRDERRVNGSTSGLIGPQTLTLTTGSQSVSWSRPTWRVALDHRFAPDIMAYVSADRGFKSGVFNTLTYADAPVAPEILDAYQVGLKTELAEHRVRLNLAAFYYDYRNIQIQEVVTGAIRLVNAAAAKLKGIDVDFAFLPVDPITLRGALEIVSGHYTSFRDAPFYSPILDSHGEPVGGNTQSAGDATGLDTVRTPNETATVTAEYRVALPTGSIKLAASNYYSAGFSWDPDNHLRESHYDVVNVSADYTRREAWNVRLWVKNLTETHYCVDATEETLLNACSPAPPRTYGITVGMHF